MGIKLGSAVMGAVNSVLRPIGLEVRQTSGVVMDRSRGFTLYGYQKRDGSFDYDKYREIQTAGNKRKINNVWVREGNIEFLSDYIRKSLPDAKFGICHGTRNGKEQEWFRKHLGCEVIGTEISDTADQFPHTIQWDFHEVKPEWVEAVDFIYSNSLDHSYDPEKCLNAWMSCLRPGGLCILEHGRLHTAGHASKLDPFGASLIQMPYLITLWGKKRWAVIEIMEAPVQEKQSSFVVIRKL